jgi:hypothetical protein
MKKQFLSPKLKLIGLMLGFVLFASPALATTIIDTYPSWDGFTSSGYNNAAQSFTAPTDNVLLSYQFGIAPRSSDGTLSFSIYNWFGGGPAGSALYGGSLPWTTASTDILVSGIGLTLTTGNQYGAVIDYLGYSGLQVHHLSIDAYSGGNAFFSFSSFPEFDLEFRAEFGGTPAVPEPATLLLLGAGLAGLAAWGWKRAA